MQGVGGVGKVGFEEIRRGFVIEPFHSLGTLGASRFRLFIARNLCGEIQNIMPIILYKHFRLNRMNTVDETSEYLLRKRIASGKGY